MNAANYIHRTQVLLGIKATRMAILAKIIDNRKQLTPAAVLERLANPQEKLILIQFASTSQKLITLVTHGNGQAYRWRSGKEDIGVKNFRDSKSTLAAICANQNPEAIVEMSGDLETVCQINNAIIRGIKTQDIANALKEIVALPSKPQPIFDPFDL
jgi:hypothetical protein